MLGEAVWMGGHHQGGVTVWPACLSYCNYVIKSLKQAWLQRFEVPAPADSMPLKWWTIRSDGSDMGRFPPSKHAVEGVQGSQPVDGTAGISEIALIIAKPT